MIAYIFGYGSLVNPEDWVASEMARKPIYGYLDDHERHFRVGINNQSPAYNKKHYRENGTRARCLIGTLGVGKKKGRMINGLAIPVEKSLFEKINEREKSYNLSGDISEYFSETLTHPLFTYYPKKENCLLYKTGKKAGNIFMPKRYIDYCYEGFRFYGGEEEFLSSTDPLDYPVKDLEFFRAPGAV